MPFVRIHVIDGASSRYKAQISHAVHSALVDIFKVPADDLFQAISVHAPDELIFAPSYLGIAHTSALVIVQITANEGRSVELKRALYARIAGSIAKDTPVGKNDVLINMIEVKRENWSFGDGIAQYAQS